MTITYLGWYHVVLTQPPDRRVETVPRVGNVKTVTHVCVTVSVRQVVRSISRPYDVERGSS